MSTQRSDDPNVQLFAAARAVLADVVDGDVLFDRMEATPAADSEQRQSEQRRLAAAGAALGELGAAVGRIDHARHAASGNRNRAEMGNEAVRAGVEDQDEDAATRLCDLLSNLRHWSDQHGVDFFAALDIAHIHHTAEVAEARTGMPSI
jgi:hypothetical protein